MWFLQCKKGIVKNTPQKVCLQDIENLKSVHFI